MIKRELYLKRIRPFYHSELIKVITGVRRCGKSVLLKQIKEELIEGGVKEERIIYINFEDYQYRKFKDPDEFYAYIENIIRDEKMYLMFDEIQNVDNFELVINSFRATHDVSIFLTGSNSKLLSGELATHLGGRTISFTMYPFTFKEFCEFKDKTPDYQLLDEYCTWGGFPLVCQAENDDMKETILMNLYDSIILKDIVQRNKIKSVNVLEKVIDYLVSTSGMILSAQNITKVLISEKQKVSEPTIYDYIRYILDAYIINKVERYDIRRKKVLAFEEKTYVCDLGIFHLKKNKVKDEFGSMMEILVYNELAARGYKIYIGKTYRGEIDFIVEKNNKKSYIQVEYLLNNEETIEREFGAFNSISDHYPKYVISYDTIQLSERNGINHIPMMKFLLEDEL